MTPESSRKTAGPHVTGKEKGEVKVRIDSTDASFDTKFEEAQP